MISQSSGSDSTHAPLLEMHPRPMLLIVKTLLLQLLPPCRSLLLLLRMVVSARFLIFHQNRAPQPDPCWRGRLIRHHLGAPRPHTSWLMKLLISKLSPLKSTFGRRKRKWWSATRRLRTRWNILTNLLKENRSSYSRPSRKWTPSKRRLLNTW